MKSQQSQPTILTKIVILCILAQTAFTKIRVSSDFEVVSNENKKTYQVLVDESEVTGPFATNDGIHHPFFWTDFSNNATQTIKVVTEHVVLLKIKKLDSSHMNRGGFDWDFLVNGTKTVEEFNLVTMPMKSHDISVAYHCKKDSKKKSLEEEEDSESVQSWGPIYFQIEVTELISGQSYKIDLNYNKVCTVGTTKPTHEFGLLMLYAAGLGFLYIFSNMSLNNPIANIGRDYRATAYNPLHVVLFLGPGFLTTLLAITFFEPLRPCVKFLFGLTSFSALNLACHWVIVSTVLNEPEQRTFGHPRQSVLTKPVVCSMKPITLITSAFAALILVFTYHLHDWFAQNIMLLSVVFAVHLIFLPLSGIQYILATSLLYMITMIYDFYCRLYINKLIPLQSHLDTLVKMPKMTPTWDGQFFVVGMINLMIAGMGIKGLRKRRLAKTKGLEGFIGVVCVGLGLLVAWIIDFKTPDGPNGEAIGFFVGSVFLILYEIVDKEYLSDEANQLPENALRRRVDAQRVEARNGEDEVLVAGEGLRNENELVNQNQNANAVAGRTSESEFISDEVRRAANLPHDGTEEQEEEEQN